MSNTQKAVIIREHDGYRDPWARLEDGREFPMAFCDRTVKLGTKGVAEFIVYPSYGLWRFKADES